MNIEIFQGFNLVTSLGLHLCLQNAHIYFLIKMHTVLQTQSNSTANLNNNKYLAEFVWVVQLHDGRFVIGADNKPGKVIANLNTGFYSAVPKSLQVNRIIAIKDQNEQRRLMTVVAKFCSKYGEDNVIVI